MSKCSPNRVGALNSWPSKSDRLALPSPFSSAKASAIANRLRILGVSPVFDFRNFSFAVDDAETLNLCGNTFMRRVPTARNSLPLLEWSEFLSCIPDDKSAKYCLVGPHRRRNQFPYL